MTATAEVAAPADSPIEARPVRWPAWTLVAICVLAGALYVWAIGAGQVGNSYYAAAAKSMSVSFSNFLFGSFDPYGVVTVDKPPMSLWPQAIAVRIFGFHGWAVLLPQVIEGVAAVFLLHRTVRLWADEKVALLAALILALTPITVAINRDNNPDTLLVLLLVAAAYAFTRSVQAAESRPRTKWLLWCAFFIGCGFLTKMLQAWIVVPGFALAYLVGSSAPVKRRILDLLAAGAVLVASSFWWVALHAWWPGSKPYIGGSTDGGAWDLIIGYNGLGRVFGGSGNRGGGPSGQIPSGQIPSGQIPSGQMPEGIEMGGPGGGMFGGQPGITRMFDASVGGQISWLLPLCLLVLAAVTVAGVLRWRQKAPGVPAERAGWFMWGSWLLVTAVVFSFAQGIFHPYYTTMLAPAVAAISAAGLVMFWRAKSFVRFLLPLSVAITAGWAFVVVSRDTAFHGWTRWAVLGVAAVAIVVLLVGLRRAGFIAALVAVLLTPAVWSTATAATASSNGVMPAAGPSERMGGGFEIFTNGQQPPNGTQPPNGQRQNGRPNRGPMMGGPGGPGGELTDEQKRILNYAKEHGNGAEITLAIAGSAQAASPYIMRTDEVVIGMGGFSGSDNAPSVDQLQQWVSEGKLKFVLGGGDRMGGGGPGGRGDNGRQEWITQHCSAVDPSAYGGGTAQTLMECHA